MEPVLSLKVRADELTVIGRLDAVERAALEKVPVPRHVILAPRPKILVIGHETQLAAVAEYAVQIDERPVLDDASLVVPLLRPGIGEVQVNDRGHPVGAPEPFVGLIFSGYFRGNEAVINIGLAAIVLFVAFWESDQDSLKPLLVLGVIALTINRRLTNALRNPQPQPVQAAIKMMLYSLVMLDATLVLLYTGNMPYAAATAALVIPAMFLGRWIFVT